MVCSFEVIEALESQPDGTPQIFERVGEQGKSPGRPSRNPTRKPILVGKIIFLGKQTNKFV